MRQRMCPYCQTPYYGENCPLCREERLAMQSLEPYGFGLESPFLCDGEPENDEGFYFESERYFGDLDDRLRGPCSRAFR